MPANPVVLTAAVLIIFSWLRFAQDLVVPFLLSLFLAVILAGPMGWMQKRGWAAPLAIGLIFLGVVILGLIMAAILGGSVHAFTEKLPEYQMHLRELASGLLSRLSALGLDVSHSRLAEVVDPGSVMTFANGLIAGIGSALSHAFLILFTVFFMLTEAWSLPEKVAAIHSERGRQVMARLAEIVESTKQYTSIKALMSAVTGLLIWAGTALIGLDFAVLWGFVAFLLNFIPTIGSIIAAVPALLLALVQLGPGAVVAVAVLYGLVNTLIGNILEPRYMGQRVGLSTLVVFLSMVFWGWLLGPVGMLLSVPLTMMAKFALAAGDNTRWVAMLLGPEAPRRLPDLESR